MSTKHITVCDRCGNSFEYRFSEWAGYFVNGIKKKTHVHFHQTLYGNPDGYSYSDLRYDLCAPCTKKLQDFLFMRKEEEEIPQGEWTKESAIDYLTEIGWLPEHDRILTDREIDV